ncbi:hypothetical protein PPYR_08318 [Photinus pyralis]|uniref:Uncharacterized protein n=1 Tax=Photinus pyralis TaxID=7054 RepID=A0A5N4AJ41_PHOPY|nr:hypothetical protein PPYR_08318 [Photinus pyralis]
MLVQNPMHPTDDEHSDRKYIVKFPFKSNLRLLNDTYEMAKRRFELLEQRLHNNDCVNFMEDYIKLNHMTKVDSQFTNSYDSGTNYLPHHCVIKESSSNNLSELKEIKSNIFKILASAGFNLRKFHNNVQELCDPVKLENVNIVNKFYKTLGVYWNPSLDVYCYSFNPTQCSNQMTKRTILTTTAQLFDPLGLLGPIIVIAKLILQYSWSLKLTWDETVPMEGYSK